MAGTTRKARGVTQVTDGPWDEMVDTHNQLIDGVEALRAALNAANGGTIAAEFCAARRNLSVQNPSTSSSTTNPGVAASLAISAGNNQSGTVAVTLGTALAVLVRDSGGTAVVGATVSWATASDGLITASSTTNSSGVAASSYTMGTAAGTQTVTATIDNGQSVSFTLTATAAAAATIVAVSATDQSGTTSTVVAAPPSVRITDAYGNPVSGVTVTFAVTGGSGSRSPATVDSASSTGLATLTSWTLGASAGLNTLTATAAGLTGSPVTFTANASATAPTQIAIFSGGAQTGVTAGQAATATVAIVKDGSNNAVQGVTVSGTVTTGSGSLNQASGVSDAAGKVSFTYTTYTTVETATLTFSFTNGSGATVSVTTTIASTFGAASKLVIATQPASNGSSGTVLPGQPVVRITDANGNIVTSNTSTVTAAVQSGNATISAGSTKAAEAGVATFTALTLVDTDGGVNVIRFSDGALTVADSDGTTLAPPVPIALQFQGPISGTVDGGTLSSFAVQIVDASSVIVPGAANNVALSISGGATLGGTTSLNATAGVATFSTVTVTPAGTYTLTATSTGLTSATSSSFTITVAGATNEPVGMTAAATLNLTGTGAPAVDTAFSVTIANGGSFSGFKWYTGRSNLRRRLISQQASWKQPEWTQTIPACPNGDDTVMECLMSPSGTNMAGGEYGLAEFDPLSGAKSLYGRMYKLFSEGYFNNSSGSTKLFYPRQSGAQPGLIIMDGVGAAAQNLKWNWQSPSNFTGKTTIKGYTRVTWLLIEFLMVLESTGGASDGHITVWATGSNGVTTKWQQTGVDWSSLTTFSVGQQFLNYYGGNTTTTIPVSGVKQSVLTGNGAYFSSSTSRIAAP